MLELFAEELEKQGVECLSVFINENNQLDINYLENPSQIIIDKVNEIKTNMSFIFAKKLKLQAIENQWHEALKTGWDSGQGHLGLKAEDVALLAGNFALAKESAALGGPIPPLVTEQNNIITFSTIHDLTMLMLAYGQARSMLSVEFAEKRKAVQNATTIQELEAIP